MRAQLSFEFLIYLAVSALSIAAVFSIFAVAEGSQKEASSGAYMEELAAVINGNMAYQSSSFYAYVPPGVCNPASGPAPASSIGGFPLTEPLYIANDICTGSGKVERLELIQGRNASYALSRWHG